MIDHWKIWFVSLIRGKHFPGPTITQVNVNQIPHHSRLTWPGSCLPFPQSPQHPFYTLCSTKSYKSMPPCSFIFAFAPSTLSVLDTLARTGLHVWLLWLTRSGLRKSPFSSFPALPKHFAFSWADHSLLWTMPTGVHVLYLIPLDQELLEGRARIMCEALSTSLRCGTYYWRTHTIESTYKIHSCKMFIEWTSLALGSTNSDLWSIWCYSLC